jgi:N-acetylglucosaminyldiphosphoundecaprenol N-acetyl-beta-D-mannosaminyltransferase
MVSTLPMNNDGNGAPRRRLNIGTLPIDNLTFAGALEAIERLVVAGAGGAVFTPNVDHVVLAERDAEFREAYAAADLSLVDGQPLVWSSRLLGERLPEKISGSDLTPALLELAARRGWSVYLLGGADGVAGKLEQELPKTMGLRIAGADAPRIGARGDAAESAVFDRIRERAPQLLLVALGAPKQELFIHRARARLGPTVCIGVGASLDFIAGRVRRAPRWVSSSGLEWLYRLAQEPRRLAYRYLVKDPSFAWILLRTLLQKPSRSDG